MDEETEEPAGDAKRVNLKEIARRAGLLPVVCGSCGVRNGTEQALERFVAEIVSALAAGDEVFIRGLGQFRCFVRKGRVVNTPVAKGGVLVTKDRRYASFKQARTLRARLNDLSDMEEK